MAQIFGRQEARRHLVEMDIVTKLMKLQDRSFADFQAKLLPTIDRSSIIGVRIPILRDIAKELLRNGEAADLMKTLPHRFFEENLLHGIFISEMKDFDECLAETERFLPFVDNWAVCDTMSPKSFKKNREKLLVKIKSWAKSSDVYTCRFGIKMLMSHFLDGDFRGEFLQIPAAVKSDEYYVNMMIAWFFATALAKQWDPTVKYLENKRLSPWVHNKTIQKAIESFRITAEQKIYLKGLKLS